MKLTGTGKPLAVNTLLLGGVACSDGEIDDTGNDAVPNATESPGLEGSPGANDGGAATGDDFVGDAEAELTQLTVDAARSEIEELLALARNGLERIQALTKSMWTPGARRPGSRLTSALAYNRAVMPRRRRPTRASRRAPRRPDFAPGPQQDEPAPDERTDLDGKPIFADDASVGAVAGALGDATGPVETRPEWIARTPAEPSRRQPGRRTAQLRQRGTSEGAARITAGQLPTFERAYIVDELRRIAIISASLFTLVVVLAIVMR